MNNHSIEEKTITLFEAALPLLTMLSSIVIGAVFFDVGAEFLILVLLFSASIAGYIARKFGVGWSDIQKSAGEKIANALPAILILLTIGMLIGTWMYSGTIPMSRRSRTMALHLQQNAADTVLRVRRQPHGAHRR